ncbi:PhoPQ-activated pathogenicity-related family protein [Caballeronia mineralivorans]|uniref:PhoPQ-activated pathogenicity-related family protein n=1 Tax=Caballeronia mineralivorans TaxID=2010198 RepID=UPI002AFF8D39|nr:PhoPQ-activated protein PqaA family protein [Caballeronia mineralivorans]MEA3103202.1 hypothetical protein [Caballeronia mineralivorans]
MIALDINGDFADVLTRYLATLAKQPLEYTKVGDQRMSGVVQHRYNMISQEWSPDGLVQPGTWNHPVEIYIPDDAVSRRAVLVVNNGINHDLQLGAAETPSNFTAATLSAIARETDTIVVSIGDVPNQYLVYQNDGKPRIEDHSVAHSWALFLSAPAELPAMSLHVAMTAAVSRAMTLAQSELKSWEVDRFIVSGASKRAWAVWLAAIADARVDAIVPFAMGLLGTRAALKHIYRSYGGNWPIAFQPYYSEHVDEQIDTDAFSQLVKIEDPLEYLNTGFASRLDIQKYIINASGDDFFVPDNANLYYHRLSGGKVIRAVPNSNHDHVVVPAEQSLITFVNRIQRGVSLPRIDAAFRSDGQAQMLSASFSEEPTRLTLWEATNPAARDFRYACGIKYTPTSLALTALHSVEIHLVAPPSGWRSVFIEVTFRDGFIATTPVFVSPEDQYPSAAPPSSTAVCQTLPGRGFRPSASS